MKNKPSPAIALLKKLINRVRKLENAIKHQTKTVAKETERKEREARPQPKESFVTKVDLPKPVEIEQSTKDAKSNRAYQNRVLVVSWLSLLAVVAYAITASCQLSQMKTATQAAQQSVDAIHDQTEVTERPWLAVDIKPGSDLYFTGGKQPTFSIELSIKNVGKSIAKNVQTDAKLYAAIPNLPIDVEATTHQNELCNSPKLVAVGKTDIFPADRPTEARVSVSTFPNQDQQQSVHLPNGKSTVYTGLYFVGCVTYLSSFSKTTHQTRFAYRLIPPADKKWPPQDVSLVFGFEMGVQVPKEKIGLMIELLADNNAY